MVPLLPGMGRLGRRNRREDGEGGRGDRRRGYIRGIDEYFFYSIEYIMYSMLEALISSRTRVKLLSLFLLNPEKEYYIREIVRITGMNYNAVRRELAKLDTFGLIIPQRKGNQQYYTVNRSFFLYDDLQRIVLKTEGAGMIIRNHLVSSGRIVCSFIYGSFARGAAGSKSDIDLFIVGTLDENLLIPLVHAAERETGREINYTLMEPEEFRKRKESADPFVMNVMKEKKIMIEGSCDD